MSAPPACTVEVSVNGGSQSRGPCVSRGQTVPLALLSLWSILQTVIMACWRCTRCRSGPLCFSSIPWTLAEWGQRFACLFTGCNITGFCQLSPNVSGLVEQLSITHYDMKKVEVLWPKKQWCRMSFVTLMIVRWMHTVALYCIKSVTERSITDFIKWPALFCWAETWLLFSFLFFGLPSSV